jgi:hypothetical protein
MADERFVDFCAGPTAIHVNHEIAIAADLHAASASSSDSQPSGCAARISGTLGLPDGSGFVSPSSADPKVQPTFNYRCLQHRNYVRQLQDGARLALAVATARFLWHPTCGLFAITASARKRSPNRPPPRQDRECRCRRAVFARRGGRTEQPHHGVMVAKLRQHHTPQFLRDCSHLLHRDGILGHDCIGG